MSSLLIQGAYSWSLNDVSMFLKEVEYEVYVDLFVYHEID